MLAESHASSVSWSSRQPALSRQLAVGNSTAAQAQEQIEEITWALPSINDTMFVPRAWSTYVGAIMSLVQEGPLAFGDDLSLIPGVTTAEQADATTYKYTVRDGVTFGDGSPLTPDDIVASFKYHMNPDVGLAARRLLLLRRHGRGDRPDGGDGQA